MPLAIIMQISGQPKFYEALESVTIETDHVIEKKTFRFNELRHISNEVEELIQGYVLALAICKFFPFS